MCASAGTLVRSLLNEVNKMKQYMEQNEVQKSDLKNDLSWKTLKNAAFQIENALLRKGLSNLQDQISSNKDPEAVNR